MTLVSVITVNLNNCVGLSRTIDSVSAQVRDNFRVEFIIVDGASTDGSVELAKATAIRSRPFFSEPDGGVYAAMNKGLNVARGEWAVFMNSRIASLLPGVLSEMMRSKNESSAEPWLIYGDNLGRNGLEPAAPLLRASRRRYSRMPSSDGISCLQICATRKDTGSIRTWISLFNITSDMRPERSAMFRWRFHA
ncbi:glycosyltransferase (plasmid) [Cupriavidus basilensis]